MSNKIIRSICYFAQNYHPNVETKLQDLSQFLQQKWYIVQTTRICLSDKDSIHTLSNIKNTDLLLNIGTLDYEQALRYMNMFLQIPNLSFNLDLTNEAIEMKHIDLLWDIIKNWAHKTFDFAYVFNNKNSSPYFPSANYEKTWFSIWLQPTDLSQNCVNLQQWLENMKSVRNQINELFGDNKEFLWIDSSIAPLFVEESSLVAFIKRLGYSFDDSVLTEIYTTITKYIKENNPKPVWLCGLMFPCLEDFDLADEYEKGNFSIERNIFLSLHSGLGIDTYPIWTDENKQKILNILKLVQALANKYTKPLSIRFVSDGKAKIWEKTNFQNQYLKDVVIRHF